MVRPVIRVPAYEPEEGYGPASFAGGDSSGLSGSGRKQFSKVPSLLFDLEDLEDATTHKQSADQPQDASLNSVLNVLTCLLDPKSEAEYMLLIHVRLAREEAAKRSCTLTVCDLADTLRRLGYSVKIRTALGGGWGGACLRNLRHTFLTVNLGTHGGSGQAQFILDPKFKDQFEVAHPTPRYHKVMEHLGQEVLASPERLTKVVDLLCHELARAFAETGTPLPPWRQAAAMLSKWQPRRSEDRDVLPCPASFLNNALGVMSSGGRPLRLKSGDTPAMPTVAQKMAGLALPVQSAGPSPISEGLEDVACGHSLPSDTSPSSSPRSVGSAADSIHIGWPEAGFAELEELAAQVVAPPHMQPQHSNVVPVQMHVKPAQQHVWEAIRQAGAELPGHRNTWA